MKNDHMNAPQKATLPRQPIRVELDLGKVATTVAGKVNTFRAEDALQKVAGLQLHSRAPILDRDGVFAFGASFTPVTAVGVPPKAVNATAFVAPLLEAGKGNKQSVAGGRRELQLDVALERLQDPFSPAARLLRACAKYKTLHDTVGSAPLGLMPVFTCGLAYYGLTRTVEPVAYSICPKFSKTLNDIAVLPLESFSLSRRLALFAKALQGVVTIHEAGMTHGNLSLKSILVTSTDDSAALVGLGSTVSGTDRILQTARLKKGVSAEHRPYAAPEELRGNLYEFDHRMDLYSIGIMLFTLATGTPPNRTFNQGIDTREGDGLLPRELAQLVAFLCQSDPERRTTITSLVLNSLVNSIIKSISEREPKGNERRVTRPGDGISDTKSRGAGWFRALFGK